jgi:hypothetical protein
VLPACSDHVRRGYVTGNVGMTLREPIFITDRVQPSDLVPCDGLSRESVVVHIVLYFLSINVL